MIVSGNWLLPGMQKKEQYKLARIRIDIDNGQDKEWGIDVKSLSQFLRFLNRMSLEGLL